jgi:hypothetical protein
VFCSLRRDGMLTLRTIDGPPVRANPEQCMVDNKNDDRANNGNQAALKFQAGYPDVTDVIEEQPPTTAPTIPKTMFARAPQPWYAVCSHKVSSSVNYS